MLGRVDFSGLTTGRRLKPVTVGQFIRDELLKPLGVSQYQLAKATGLGPMTISEIIRGKRHVTATTAIKLGYYFGINPQFFINMQSRYDMLKAMSGKAGTLAKKIIPFHAQTGA
ncbi:MAG: addiction module antidote protein, HigA family [Alphaproteobacteria bacterium]|nr:addiction module antidote protein, HigA family [Alphaproteobacteria bacterium]NDG03773.1 addiction module antidote protein, HigA family [Alphaproteobacteria bacterium]